MITETYSWEVNTFLSRDLERSWDGPSQQLLFGRAWSGAAWGSKSCVPQSINFISCVPKCLLHVYQLRPKVSSSSVSVASRVVSPKHDELRPAVSKDLYQLHRKLGEYKMSNNLKILTQFYFILYKIVFTHTELLNDIENIVVILPSLQISW